MKRSNLSAEITNLLSRGVLKRDKLTQIRSRHPGRPREYLALSSSWTIQSICDELEYRKNQYESEIKKLDSAINNEFWVEWDKIANDDSKHNDFLDKYTGTMLKRINLGGEKGSSSPKAFLQDTEGKKTILVDPSGNTRNLPKEISYQGIKYWLRLLQSPTIRLLGFLMDNAPKEHSIQEIAEGTNLEEDTLSRLLPSLEKSQKIVASHKNEVKTYKFNMQNQEIIGLMDIMGLRRIKLKSLRLS